MSDVPVKVLMGEVRSRVPTDALLGEVSRRCEGRIAIVAQRAGEPAQTYVGYQKGYSMRLCRWMAALAIDHPWRLADGELWKEGIDEADDEF